MRRREINAGVITGLKTGRRKFRTAVSEGKTEAARAEFVKLTSALDKAAKRGIIHGNVADRQKSRLTKALARTKA